jgi:hypothetical protein
MLNFKLEHHRQSLLPWPKFILRLGTYFAFSLGVIAISLLLGILGYHLIGKLNFLDSFYMSCMILTGMGPVSEITSASGKIFSSIYALYSGIVFLSTAAVFFTPIIHRILHILHVDNSTEDKNSDQKNT